MLPTFDCFALLGLPRRFDLDGQALRTAHRSLAAQAHPDLAHGQADAAAREDLLSRLNTALRTLSDPLARAEHLLELLCGPPQAPVGKSVEPALLAKVMEWQEELADAPAGPAGDQIRERIRHEVQAEQARALDSLSAALAPLIDHPDPTGQPDHIHAARLAINALRTLGSVRTQA